MGGLDALVPAGEPVETGLPDAEVVDFSDDLVILPDRSADDSDTGWGDGRADNDERLLADRPPHWG